ncbi:MAG: response regulator [Selenomonadaceae bacterium]|nr:response regulator [Selenomonadaceae bacterium]
MSTSAPVKKIYPGNYLVLFVSEGTGYLNITIREKILEAGFHVISSSASPDALRRAGSDVRVLFLYLSPAMLAKPEALQAFRKQAAERRLSIFVLANQHDELYQLEQIIPKQFILREFTRPIDFSEMVTGMCEALGSLNNRRRRKILAVDDSGAMLRNIKTWLGSEYDVNIANSSLVAIKHICLDQPDLVLLDYEMPICDGPQLLRMLRADPTYADLPIIFLTGKNDRDSITQVMSLHPAGYILKSNGVEAVKTTVHKFFNP